MVRTIRENIHTPYSLHDMNIVSIEVEENKITMRTQSGMVKTTPPYSQPDGYIEFHDVQWDFCYVYLLGITGNEGTFSGKKMSMKDFISKYKQFGFSVMDETFGYNMTKYNGYLSSNREHHECIIEIYHEGDMVYVVEE